MSAADVGVALAEAERYAAEAAAEARRPRAERQRAGRASFMPDPDVEAADCAARVVEWRRVAALMTAQGWAAYEPENDVVGHRCAVEYDAWRQTTLERLQQDEQEQRDAAEEIRAEVWLNAESSRRVRALCSRFGVSPERLLAQVAEHTRPGDGGTVTVTPFTPG
ncbi:hypothetical protein [Streptomyces uncialis]|uniref:hypothetical protein n=1 Tax=Streptomyces uncialis TaxID=1048205 RepID=UPI0037A76030